jgi:hypothetical protein
VRTVTKAFTGTALGFGLLLGAVGEARAEDAAPKLSVHGFLTQAYGRATNDSDMVLGITKNGTTDYRNAALQFSYSVTDKDRLVLQFSHERIASDLKATILPDVALDWAFFQHRFSDHTSLKVGRVPIPVGIYNEIRDVGTLLPFYRPPDAFYRETAFLSETVDGVVASHTFGSGRWTVEVEPFVGGWNTIAFSGSTNPQVARVENNLGATGWLRTPLSGLRVGGSAYRNTIRRFGTPTPAPEDREVWLVSVDGSFSRFSARGEYSKAKDGDSRDRAYYGLGTVKVTEKAAVNLQYARAWVSWFAGRRAGVTAPIIRDMAAGVSYAFRPNLVAKFEGHDGEGSGVGVLPPVNRYFLATISASF